MSARSPRPKRKPIKTENVTESHLACLQKELDRYNSEIASIRKKIDKHLQQQKDYEIMKRDDEEKLKKVEIVKNILNKYRKKIGMPDPSQQLSSSFKTSSTPTGSKNSSPISKNNSTLDSDFTRNQNSGSLVDFTKYRFDKKRAEIDELANEIERLQRLLESLQSQASKTKTIIQNLNIQIPDLKANISQLNFKKIFDPTLLDKKLYKAICSVEFYQDNIKERKEKIKQLKIDIQNLQLQKPSLKSSKHPIKDSIISIPPSPEMAKYESFEKRKIANGMKSLKPVLQNASINQINSISEKMKEIKTKMNSTYKSLNKVIEKTNREVIKFKLLKPSDSHQQNKEKMNNIAMLKERIEKNKIKLKEVQTDNPKMRETSPEGLVKWRNDLLNQINVESTKYDSDIKLAQRQLTDAKKIYDTKIKSLQRSIDEKNGK